MTRVVILCCVVLSAFLVGMVVQSHLPEPYPDFFTRRLPKTEPVYGLRLNDGNNHPLIGKDEKGFIWTGGEFQLCRDCHKDRWNGGKGPAFHMRLHWTWPELDKYDGEHPSKP